MVDSNNCGSHIAADFDLNDVFDVISQDPVYSLTSTENYAIFNRIHEETGIGSAIMTSIEPEPPCPQNAFKHGLPSQRNAYIKIIEQPQSKALRFRYQCEGRSAGSIPGVNSTPENKTYPTVQIEGYKGHAVVVVSCVTTDPPYKPHPHNLVGREGCKYGLCTIRVNPETMRYTFNNLGIQCVKKTHVQEALKGREERRVDPFKTGFAHANQPQSINLNAVRLCFQAFLQGPEPDKAMIQLDPVVSDIIYDKKAATDLVICKLSHCSSSVDGDEEIILLCDKVSKDDIKVRFFERHNGKEVWEADGKFQNTDVHKQYAISLKTPKYINPEIDTSIQVYIELVRPSDNTRSEALPFTYRPRNSDILRRKIMKRNNSDKAIRHLETFMSRPQVFPPTVQVPHYQAHSPFSKSPEMIKLEPSEGLNYQDHQMAEPGIEVKPAISPQHYTGGTVLRVGCHPSVSPLSYSVLTHDPHDLSRESSPGHGIQMAHDPSPYEFSPSPNDHTLTTVYESPQRPMSSDAPLPCNAEGGPSVCARIYPDKPAPQLLDLDAQKVVEYNVTDISLIDSGDLLSFDSSVNMQFIENHLSENLSISQPDHIIIRQNLNDLDAAGASSVSVSFDNFNNFFDTEMHSSSSTTPSMKILRKDLDMLNNS